MACIYTIKDTLGKDLIFKDKASLAKYIRDNNLHSRIEVEDKSDDISTTDDLALVLRQVKFGEPNFHPDDLRKKQEGLLDTFIRIEAQSQYFYKVGAAIKLTKGLGKGFDNIDGIKRSLKELGLSQYGGSMTKDIPIDVTELLSGEGAGYKHEITSNNLRIMNEIDALSRTMFMERTPAFQFTTTKVVANMKPSFGMISDKVDDLKDELSAFSQIAAYKQWIKANDKLTSTLRNSLIYDTEGNIPTIVDIVKQASNLAPNNTFLQFVLPVSTTLKLAKKKQRNPTNRDLLNTIEGKTRGRLEPDLISSLMDSFTELYQNPKTQFHAKALFDYLIVKDGLMFKNKSFIKMVPTIMFKEMSDATSNSTRLMAANSIPEYSRLIKDLAAQEITDKEGNFVPYFNDKEKQALNGLFKEKDILAIRESLFKKVFGLGFNDLYHRFEEIFSTDVRNQFDLDLIRPRVKSSKGITKMAEGITSAVDDEGNDYMHVTLFPKAFEATEKGSDERKEVFKETLKQLQDANFGITTIEDEKNPEKTKSYINFKKFIRLRDTHGKYQLYQLISVTRDKKIYSGAQMTANGDLVPIGTYGVYKHTKAVGAANSIGVADLGKRPTREELLKVINDKLKNKGDDKPPPLPPPPTDNGGTPSPTKPGAPVTPQPGETIGGGIFGGLQQGNYDPSTENMPLDFFTDEQIDKDPC